MVRRSWRRGVAFARALSPDECDVLLYGGCAVFALLTALLSGFAVYRQWGTIATGAYIAGMIGAAVFAWRARRARRAPSASTSEDGGWQTHRVVTLLVVLAGATLVPLALEVWSGNAQSEVKVVEHAGDRVIHGQDPYRLVDPHKPPAVGPGEPPSDAFDPYLPLMAALGIAHSTDGPPTLTDPRVGFSLVTIVLALLAIALCRGPRAPRLVVLQCMTVFPTAALPLATGGDDVPVAALLLLGLVLLHRKRPFASGLTLGVASAMKMTAWPLAAIAVLAASDGPERSGRARRWFVAGLALVAVPAVLPFALENVSAFVQNVISFPLGLAGIGSPAASPLPGHVIVSLFPHLHRIFTLVAVIDGALILGWVLVRRTPRTASSVALVVAWAMTAAIFLAPAARVGYLLYPVDLFAWAWLLRSEERTEAGAEHPLAPRAPSADPHDGDGAAARSGATGRAIRTTGT